MVQCVLLVTQSEGFFVLVDGYCSTVQGLLDCFERMKKMAYDYMSTAHCNTLQHTATHCNTLQHTAAHCNILQHVLRVSTVFPNRRPATVCLQHTDCIVLSHTAAHCRTLAHTASTATHYATLQHTAKRARTAACDVAAVCCSVLLCVAVCCSVQRVAVCCSVLQCVAVCCSTLYHNTI